MLLGCFAKLITSFLKCLWIKITMNFKRRENVPSTRLTIDNFIGYFKFRRDSVPHERRIRWNSVRQLLAIAYNLALENIYPEYDDVTDLSALCIQLTHSDQHILVTQGSVDDEHGNFSCWIKELWNKGHQRILYFPNHFFLSTFIRRLGIPAKVLKGAMSCGYSWRPNYINLNWQWWHSQKPSLDLFNDPHQSHLTHTSHLDLSHKLTRM